MSSPRQSLTGAQLVALAALVVVLGLTAVFAFRILFVLFAGVLFALILRAAAGWVSRVTRLPYVAVLTALVLLGIGSTVLGGVLLVPRVGEQLETLSRELPKIIDGARDRLKETPVINHFLSPDAGAQPDPKKLAAAALAGLGGSVQVLSGLVVAFFIGVYGAAQPQMYSDAALAITPRRYERHVERALKETAHNLTRWLWGRILAMIFVGVSTSIVFHLLHIPLALTLGVFAGFLTFIEYAGAILSAFPPVLLGFSQSPTVGLAVLSAYVVLHVVEGYVITPLLARASVHLPPALTLAAQALLGELCGILGLTFSTPLFVVGVSAVKAFREENARQ
ncbi:MAG TPA: AI-2E family transporter [Polyangiaceae bacterium]|jgi:predicted PurR-regulated permease PerM|nr:AI-2E family transporter [Polyangiaceae bacterium]